MSKETKKKLFISILAPIVIAILGYLSTFFLTTFPESQANIKLLEERYDHMGGDIREIKEAQKEFSKDQKMLINFLLKTKHGNARENQFDG